MMTVLEMSESVLESGISELDDSIILSLDQVSDEMKKREQLGSTLRSLISKSKRLTEAGFFKMTDGYRDPSRGGRAPIYFILHEIHKPEFEAEDSKELRERAQGHRNTRAKTTQATLKFLRESDAQLISHVRDIKPVTETIFTGLLDRAMRFTTKEKPRGNRINAKFRIKGTEILVQATTATGPSSELAALADQRVIRAVLSEIADFIDNEIEKYITEVETPRQSSLFNDDDEIIDPFDLLEEVQGVSEITEDRDLNDGEYISKTQLQREHLENVATSRIHNSFFLDTVNVAKRMEYKSPHSSSTRRFINQSFRRLYDTSFRLVIRGKSDAEIAKIMQMFGLSDVATDFRFFTDLKSQYEEEFFDKKKAKKKADRNDSSRDESEHVAVPVEVTGSEIARTEHLLDPHNDKELKRVRFWRLSLDSLLFEKLLNKEERKLFTAHNDIMREHSGLGQTLYNLFTSTLGRRNRGNKERPFKATLSQLHNTLWATRKYHKFEEEFCELMKRYMPAGSWDESLKYNQATMFGYVMTLEKDEVEKNGRTKVELNLTVVRDRNDPLSGDNSYYNLRVTKPDAAKPEVDLKVDGPNPENFLQLDSEAQQRLLAKWKDLTLNEKKAFNSYGVASPHIRELLEVEL